MLATEEGVSAATRVPTDVSDDASLPYAVKLHLSYKMQSFRFTSLLSLSEVFLLLVRNNDKPKDQLISLRRLLFDLADTKTPTGRSILPPAYFKR